MDENKKIDEILADVNEPKDPAKTGGKPDIFTTVNNIEDVKLPASDILEELMKDVELGPAIMQEGQGENLEKVQPEIIAPKVIGEDVLLEKKAEPAQAVQEPAQAVQEPAQAAQAPQGGAPSAQAAPEQPVYQQGVAAPAYQQGAPVPPNAPAYQVPHGAPVPPVYQHGVQPPQHAHVPPNYQQPQQPQWVPPYAPPYGQPTYPQYQTPQESPYPPSYYAPQVGASIPTNHPNQQQYASFQNEAAEEEEQPYQWDFASVDQAAVAEKEGKRGLRVFGSLMLTITLMFASGFAVYAFMVAANGGDLAFDIPGVELPSVNDSATLTPSSNENTPNITINPGPSYGTGEIYPMEDGTLSNTAIYDKVSPSVVGVISYASNGFYKTENEGSGIIMSADGYVITNAHVVSGAQTLEIVLVDGTGYDAEIVGTDSATDLAVLKVNATDLVAAEFGDSNMLKIGERVLAIGNPAGMQFASSLTVGCVSALNRSISAVDSGYALELIQTDAAINPGNSGGALINAYGQVIGINSAKIGGDQYEGMGFAIPITDAVPILDDIIINGKVTTRAMLGITAETISAVYAQQANIPVGLHIVNFAEGSTLEENGAMIGDIITHIDAYPIFSVDSCSEVLKSKEPGDTVTLSLYRVDRLGKGTTINITAQLIGSGN